MKNCIIYPGTFDPITLGHVDLVERALRLFDQVIIAIAENLQKQSLFSLEERIELASKIFADNKKVKIESFGGLLTGYVKQKETHTILRGLRVISDFEYEFQMASANRVLYPDLETIFLMPSDKYTYISSSIVREIVTAGGDASKFVPPIVTDALKKLF